MVSKREEAQSPILPSPERQPQQSSHKDSNTVYIPRSQANSLCYASFVFLRYVALVLQPLVSHFIEYTW